MTSKRTMLIVLATSGALAAPLSAGAAVASTRHHDGTVESVHRSGEDAHHGGRHVERRGGRHDGGRHRGGHDDAPGHR